MISIKEYEEYEFWSVEDQLRAKSQTRMRVVRLNTLFFKPDGSGISVVGRYYRYKSGIGSNAIFFGFTSEKTTDGELIHWSSNRKLTQKEQEYIQNYIRTIWKEFRELEKYKI